MSASNTERVCVAGASGTGKSTYVKRIIQGHPRVVIFDPQGEYPRSGAIACHSIAQCQQIMRQSFDSFMIALRPPAMQEPVYLNKLSHLILQAQKPYEGAQKGAELLFVVEEMNLSFPVDKSAEKNAPAFAEICSRGRHSWIGVLGVTQRLAEVSPRFRGNLSECVVFRQSSPMDRKAAALASGADPAQIEALQDLEFLRGRAGSISEGKLTF